MVGFGTRGPLLVIALSIAIVLQGVVVSPADGKITDVFVVPLSHLDIGFTDTPAAAADHYRRDLDLGIRILDNQKGMRWNIESLWQLEQWLHAHTAAADRERLQRVVDSGALGLSASYASMHSSLMTSEEMLRMFYPAQRLRADLGVALETAVMNDVPGFAAYMPQALAQSGVRYLIAGTNRGFGGGTSIPLAQMPFYWEGPDGSRVLTWVSHDGYLEGIFRWELPRDDYGAFRTKIRELEQGGYPYSAILILDGYGDNSSISPILSRHAMMARWGNVADDLTVHYSTVDAFFHHMEAHHGEAFPTYAGDWGRVWEQARAAGPWQMARLRELQNTLPGVEALATFAHVTGRMPFPYAEFAQVWQRMWLLTEHTGGPEEGWPEYMTQQQVNESNRTKREYAVEAEDILSRIRAEAMASLSGEEVTSDPRGSSSDRRVILAYNPLSWSRSGVVILPESALPVTQEGRGMQVVDASTNVALPSWTVEGGLAFYAEGLPPMGMAEYRLETDNRPSGYGSPPGSVETASVTKPQTVVLESPWYRVELDAKSGLILSVYDRELDTQILNTASRFGFNQLLTAFHRDAFLGGAPRLVNAQVEAVLPLDRPDSVGVRLVYGAGTPRVHTEIRLSSFEKRLEITNVLDRTLMRHVPYDRHSEHYFFSFPFDLPPTELEVRYHGAASFQSIRDTLPGANATSIISRSAVDLRGNDWGVFVAHREPFAFSVGSIGYQGSTFLPHEATLISRVVQKTDESHTTGGIRPIIMEPDAPHHLEFSYALTTRPGAFDAVDATRFGLEWVTPILAHVGGSGGIAGSILDVDAPNVIVTALKMAESGDPDALIVRLQEVAGESTEVEITSTIPFSRAMRTTAVEEPVEKTYPVQPLRVEIQPYETVTLQLQVARP